MEQVKCCHDTDFNEHLLNFRFFFYILSFVFYLSYLFPLSFFLFSLFPFLLFLFSPYPRLRLRLRLCTCICPCLCQLGLSGQGRAESEKPCTRPAAVFFSIWIQAIMSTPLKPIRCRIVNPVGAHAPFARMTREPCRRYVTFRSASHHTELQLSWVPTFRVNVIVNVKM